MRCVISHPRAVRGAFTLIELLVVISIIALLVGILLPALGRARQSAKAMACLSQVRQMELAHTAYMVDQDGQMAMANLAHGGVSHGVTPWYESLQPYYDSTLVLRSPLDESPHWGPAPAGEAIPSSPASQRRVTSYGINTFLNVPTVPWGPGFASPYRGYRWDDVPEPTRTVHFLLMAEAGEYAGADHPHVENWWNAIVPAATPAAASSQVQIDAVSRGDTPGWDSRTNWGFLDGHASAARFEEVYRSNADNDFDPALQ